MSEQSAAPLHLEGVRVLDFSMYLAGPYATRLMADHGAEVIKVEPPTGDTLRGAPPMVEGRSRYFGHFNCGKKSIVVDLKDPDGIAAIKRLVAECDVLLENFRPGVMKRLGLDYDTLRLLKPDLIYCSVSGYGQTGSASSRPAFAPIVHAGSGYDLVQFGYARGLDRPLRNRSTAADILAATHAFGAVCAALLRRERAGLGEHIDVTLIDSMHNLVAFELQASQVEEPEEPIVFEPVRTADGFLMTAPVSQANFAALARAIGREEWLDDDRFGSLDSRRQHWGEMMAELEIWALGHTSAEAEAIIQKAGCPCTRYRSIGESFAEPHVAERGAARVVDDGGGPFKVANAPMRYQSCDVGCRPWVASLGEHDEEILGG